MDNDKKTMIRLTRPTEETDGQSSVNQGILSLNPRQTYELLKANGLVEGLDDGWNKKWTVCWLPVTLSGPQLLPWYAFFCSVNSLSNRSVPFLTLCRVLT